MCWSARRLHEFTDVEARRVWFRRGHSAAIVLAWKYNYVDFFT